jgi:hypothetical protein
MKADHYVMIDETCSCGSKIKIEHTSLREAEEFLVRWRSRHVHYKPAYPYVTYGGGAAQTLPYTHTFTVNNGEEPPGLSVVNS